jgi:hypothetical protein
MVAGVAPPSESRVDGGRSTMSAISFTSASGTEKTFGERSVEAIFIFSLGTKCSVVEVAGLDVLHAAGAPICEIILATMLHLANGLTAPATKAPPRMVSAAPLWLSLPRFPRSDVRATPFRVVPQGASKSVTERTLIVEMVENEAAEYMVTSLAGQYHPALLARPDSGVIFDGARKRWVLESDSIDCDMYVP